MAIKTGKKNSRCWHFPSQGSTHESTHASGVDSWVDLCCKNQRMLFWNFLAQISRGRLMSRLMPCGSTHESTHRSCQARKLACQGEFLHANQLTVPWVDSWVDSCTSNLHNFKNISPNTMKFSPIDFKSFVLPNGTIKSGF